MQHSTWTKPKYQYVQLIAYEVPTLNLTDPLPASSLPKPGADRRLPDADALNRVQRLLDVLGWTRQTIPDNVVDFQDPLTPSKTLKIFIAPEFYFRATPDGYSWNTMQSILGYLQTELENPMLADWLIVPGTICSHQDPHPEKGGKTTFFNTASVIKGGVKGTFTFVHKERRSTIDGVPPALSDGTQDPKFASILGTWAEQKARLFTIDGITFGFDVCLDHLTQALKRVCIDWTKNEKNALAPSIDVHLITSCGMNIKANSVSARTGGCVFLCDGKPNASPPWKRSDVRRVGSQETTDLSNSAILSGQDAAGHDLTTPVWQQNVPNAYAIPRPALVPANQWFANRIVCYPRFKLFEANEL